MATGSIPLTWGDPVTHSLRLQEMAPWLGSTLRRSAVLDVHHALNRTVRSIFLYRIHDGEVSLLEKPGFRVRDTFNDSREPEPEGPVIYREEYIRAQMYREFFARILPGITTAIDMVIAVDVNDTPIAHADAPVLAFQKPRSANTVLIPDVDFIHANFYIPMEYRDDTPYAAKAAWAVFAGSTTGGRTIKAADVAALAIPRLRAGVAFKGSPHVDFRIPRIVQCESPEVAAMITDLGIKAEPCSWQEQFRYRFILSMDGNGATCSRVVVGLLSQSALAKYDSPNLLYYFGALVPWRHYIPIASDDDVPNIVEAERRNPMMFSQVAEEGRNFARRYLGRAGCCSYTAELLSLYESCLSDAPQGAQRQRDLEPANALPLVELGAHIQGVGDVWGWPGEWVGEIGSGRAIESIAVVPTGVPSEAITCQTVLDDGSLSDITGFGAFCGTRGRNMPLRGFALQLRSKWQRSLECQYSGYFSDGTTVGPMRTGEMCQSASGAVLEAFHVKLDENVAEPSSCS